MRVLGTLLVLAGFFLLGTVVTGWIAWWTPAQGESPAELASAISGRMVAATGGGVVACLVGVVVLVRGRR